MLPGLARLAGTPGSGANAAVDVAVARMHLQHDWPALIGRVIDVRRDGRTIRTGRVDGTTSDGAILWISAHGVQPRTMYERGEGFTAWIDYEWETRTLAG